MAKPICVECAQAAALHWAACAPYHVFFGVLVRDLHLPDDVTSAGMAIGVVAEIAALLAFPRLERRFPLGTGLEEPDPVALPFDLPPLSRGFAALTPHIHARLLKPESPVKMRSTSPSFASRQDWLWIRR